MKQEIIMVDTRYLKPNPKNPRSEINDISDLVASIKARGWISPLTVKRLEKGFQVIAGNRRLAAAKELKISPIPCSVVECDDSVAYEIATSENIVRQAMSPEDECAAVAQMVEDGKSPRDIAAHFGRHPRWAIGRYRIFKLGEKAMELLKQKKISLAHAEMLTMAPEDRLDYFLDFAKWNKPEDLQRKILNEKKNLNEACFNAKKICEKCKDRTAEQPDIFGGIDDSHCLNSDCFEKHVAAFVKSKKKYFRDAGYEEVDAEDVFDAAHEYYPFIDACTESEIDKKKIEEIKKAGIKAKFYVDEDGKYGLVFNSNDLKDDDSEEEQSNEIPEYRIVSVAKDMIEEDAETNLERLLKKIPEDIACLILDAFADNDYDDEFKFVPKDGKTPEEAETEDDEEDFDQFRNIAHVGEDRRDDETTYSLLARAICGKLDEIQYSEKTIQFLSLDSYESYKEKAKKKIEEEESEESEE